MKDETKYTNHNIYKMLYKQTYSSPLEIRPTKRTPEGELIESEKDETINSKGWNLISYISFLMQKSIRLNIDFCRMIQLMESNDISKLGWRNEGDFLTVLSYIISDAQKNKKND